MWMRIILLKDSPRDALKEGNDFGLQHFTEVPVAIEMSMIRNRPQTITPGVRLLCRSITHSGKQRSPE
ncbi:hypothetical protein TNCV_563431 [Trichonephila clavipes]|nr:hypothetical protein TNCV_563431 [Trichonephila clavipes]